MNFSFPQKGVKKQLNSCGLQKGIEIPAKVWYLVVEKGGALVVPPCKWF